MLTQLFLAAKVAWKKGLTDKRPLPYVAWLINVGGLNDVAREVNAVSPELAQKLLNSPYQLEKDYEQNAYRRSSWDSMVARLYPLLTDDIVAGFNGSDIKVRELIFSKKPITIYLRWHESDLLALAPLMKFVWEAMISELITAYDLAPDKSQCQRVLLDIEEAGRTGIPNLPEHVSTLRSRHISVTAVFQDRSQGYALYGRDRAISLFNNFRYQIYFRQDDLETAQYLETRCGSKSGFAHSKTEHEGSTSTGESEQKIPHSIDFSGKVLGRSRLS
jgi:type IV secretory pathway TraG/TraD family ATPase VirD4